MEEDILNYSPTGMFRETPCMTGYLAFTPIIQVFGVNKLEYYIPGGFRVYIQLGKLEKLKTKNILWQTAPGNI